MVRRGCSMFRILLGVFALSCLCLRAQACEPMAQTDYERLFCEIQAKSPSSLKMSLHEFRRNPVKTQRLLLVRPARKLGLSMPEISASAQNASRTATVSKSKTDIDTSSLTDASSTKTNGFFTHAEGSLPSGDSSSSSILVGCQLQLNVVSCGKQIFRRVNNRANTKLKATALGEQNRLNVSRIEGDLEAVKPQLKLAYIQYIDAMLSIGLAEHSLSFTKFANLFIEAQKQGLDFADRLGLMFEYLKKDKKQLAVASQAQSPGPQNIEQCYQLTPTIIICDNVAKNWVFQN